jgi:hypothetical protein
MGKPRSLLREMAKRSARTAIHSQVTGLATGATGIPRDACHPRLGETRPRGAWAAPDNQTRLSDEFPEFDFGTLELEEAIAAVAAGTAPE